MEVISNDNGGRVARSVLSDAAEEPRKMKTSEMGKCRHRGFGWLLVIQKTDYSLLKRE